MGRPVCHLAHSRRLLAADPQGNSDWDTATECAGRRHLSSFAVRSAGQSQVHERLAAYQNGVRHK